jgi:hypothetical protein
MAARSNGSRRPTLAALQLLPMSALKHIADSRRTLRHVLKVPIVLQKSKIDQPQKSGEI